jgi:N-acyl homoserine lactone hydrolase
MRVWILPVGRFDILPAVLTPGDSSRTRLDIPVYAYLLDLGSTLMLFDTGCSHQLASSPRDILGDEVEALTPRMGPADHIRAQLAQIGFKPDDVSLVVNSHLHFDHAGGNEAFGQAEFWMQRAEWEAAASSPEHYPDPAWRPLTGRAIRWLDGDTPVGQGVTLLATPGHTPGHQSLWVEVEHGPPIVFCGDAVYTAAHFDPDHVGASVDRGQAARSVERLRQLAASGARPFFSHDPDQARREGWRLSPAFY